VKLAIILSCFISAGFISMYSVVLGQVQQMENFYSNMDKYVSDSMSSQNTVANPYQPQPLQNMSHPTKNTPIQSLAN
jgi:hypothetical protein